MACGPPASPKGSKNKQKNWYKNQSAGDLFEPRNSRISLASSPNTRGAFDFDPSVIARR